MTQIGGLQPDSNANDSPMYQSGGRGSIGTAIANIPAQMQNAKMLQQRQQLQQLQIQQQKLQVGQQMYGQLYSEVGSDPIKLADPGTIKRAQDIAKQTGVQPALTKDAKGNTILDVNVLMPRPDIATMKPDDQMGLYQKIVAMPEDDRKAFIAGQHITNVPPEWLSAPQYNPLSAGGTTAVINNLIGPKGAVEEFSNGKLDPTRFAGEVAAAKGLATSVGLDTSQWETPEFLNAGVSSWAQSQMDWLHTRGIVSTEDAATRSRMEADKAKQAIALIGLKGAMLTEKQNEFKATSARLWQTHTDNLAMAGRKLDEQYTALGSLMNNRQFMQNIQTVGALQKPVADLRTQYDAANTALTRVTTAIQSAHNANPGEPPTKELQDQYDALEHQIGTIGPQLDYYERLSHSNFNGAQSGVGGKPITTVPGTQSVIKTNTPVQTGKSKSGKAIYSSDGGATWLYGAPPAK